MKIIEWQELKNAKPCKFCGVTNEELARKYIKIGMYEDGYWIVRCRNCSAESDSGTYEYASFCWQSGDITIPTHSEKDILKGCLQLMESLADRFRDYIEFMGWEPGEDMQPIFSYSPMEIVRKLFLWHTSHSGGTSTMAKCRELGINDSGKSFVFGEVEDEQD